MGISAFTWLIRFALLCTKLYIAVFGIAGLAPTAKKRWWMAVPAAVFLACIFFVPPEHDAALALCMGCGIATVCCMVGRPRDIVFVVLAFLAASLVESFVAVAVYLLNGADVVESYYSQAYMLVLIDTLTIGLFSGLYFLRRRLFRTRTDGGPQLNGTVWLLLACVMAMILYIEPFQTLALTQTSPERVVSVAMLALGGLLLFVVGVRMYLKSSAARMESAMYEKLLQQQKAHYTQTLEKDRQLRMFRHDLKVHLACLRGFTQGGDMDAVEGYLEQMSDTLRQSNHSVDTGNDVLDIILSSAMEEAGQDVRIQCRGHVQSHLAITEMDFCILLSNLLSNAIEAARQCGTEGEKTVSIGFRSLESSLVIDIENPAGRPIVIRGGRLVTTKSDSWLHGLGSQSIEKVARKYGGSVAYTSDDKKVCAQVVMHGVIAS